MEKNISILEALERKISIWESVDMNIHSKSIKDISEINLSNKKVYICKYIRNEFTEKGWQEFIEYDNEHYESTYNEKCTTPSEVKRSWYTDTSQDAINHRWLLIRENKLIGRAAISYYTESSGSYDDNKDTAEIFIDVHHMFRRRGYGTHLHNVVMSKLREDKKTKIQSDYILDCSAKFCKKFNYNIESARNISRLYKNDITFDQVEKWSKLSQREIMIFNTVPDKYLDEFCKLYTACGRMAPDYDGDYTASEQTTPDERRTNEKIWKEKGIVQYTAVSIEVDGTLSGMTEMDYFEKNPGRVDQGLTGVLKEYRGNKIGMQLKAALLVHLNKVNPSLEIIHTANNKKNVAMLAINEAFGFKSYIDHFLISKKID